MQERQIIENGIEKVIVDDAISKAAVRQPIGKAKKIEEISEENIQALYATKPVEEISAEGIQVLYAAKPVEETENIQALYSAGPVTSGPDINITYSQLEENISLLKNSISSLKSSWNDGTKKNLDTLDNSWVGPDCAEYTSKLNKMDKKVQNTISALELLCSAYEEARDMMKDSQRNVLTSINNIDVG